MDSYNVEQISAFIKATWQDSIIAELQKYIKIPCKSPAFDSNWQANGHIETAIQQLKTWALNQNIPNMSLDIIRLPNRTPLLFLEIQSSARGAKR